MLQRKPWDGAPAFPLVWGAARGAPDRLSELRGLAEEMLSGLSLAWAFEAWPEAASGPEGSALTVAPPTDAMVAWQWHITGQGGRADINLRSVWVDFTGRGISVAVSDDGFDYSHPDLARNYDQSRDRDFRGGDFDARAEAGDAHGTAVMGVIGAARDGQGAVGVAYDATLVGLRIGFGARGNPMQYAASLREGALFDVLNYSWGYRTPFQDNFNNAFFMGMETALIHGTTNGRGGLGTTYVTSAMNNRGTLDSANFHNLQTNLYAVTVAATDEWGRHASFSNWGSSLLLAAPGTTILTTDGTDASGTGYAGGNHVTLQGTSFSAPMVAGTVALMLDANDRLGWRDVHEILAYSSRLTDGGHWNWKWNAARDWNGGGLHTSTDYGFGLLDAHAAVRLAETWAAPAATSANMMRVSAASTAPAQVVRDNSWNGGTPTSSTITIGQDLILDRVEVELNISHLFRGDLVVTVVSPSGTESALVWRSLNGRDAGHNIVFDITSTQFWGENARGTWTLNVWDANPNGLTGSLDSWRLNAVGDAPTPNNTYVYTDEFASLGAQPRRASLSDASGTDAINASAVTTAVQIDLATGALIAGRTVSFAAGTLIERAFGGDGADTLRGNAADNWIWGGRGNDVLAGRGGADVFAFGVSSGRDVIEDFAAEDDIWLLGGVTVASLQGSVATLSDGATLTAANGWQWSMADFALRSGWLA